HLQAPARRVGEPPPGAAVPEPARGWTARLHRVADDRRLQRRRWWHRVLPELECRRGGGQRLVESDRHMGAHAHAPSVALACRPAAAGPVRARAAVCPAPVRRSEAWPNTASELPQRQEHGNTVRPGLLAVLLG